MNENAPSQMPLCLRPPVPMRARCAPTRAATATACSRPPPRPSPIATALSRSRASRLGAALRRVRDHEARHHRHAARRRRGDGFPNSGTRERISSAIGPILLAGADSGAFRAGVDPDDVTALLLGVFLSTGLDPSSTRTERVLDLVLDALRAPGRA
ncbi:hypothetical protein [Agromyces intestinalis]|uniref:SbtR family transcriptional regulator n=1 Tax=Agromyces intestinalis TaxID=2592652 RepID=UPI00319E60E6